jgi:transcriptional regulator with XRE-family HTH domain
MSNLRNLQCFQCGGECDKRIAPPHAYKMKYDGGTHEVLVNNMPEWHCRACDVSVVDEESDSFLQDALRTHIGLLAPNQIRAGLKKLKITQEKFAEQLGCAAETVSRWLNGAVLQSRTYDRFMRVYFQCPDVRSYLENFSPERPFGEEVVQPAHAVASRSDAVDFMAALFATELNLAWTGIPGAASTTTATSRAITRQPAARSRPASQRPHVNLTFDAIQQQWTALTESSWGRGAATQSGPASTSSTSRIPAWAWFGVGGEAA